jgi:hypothetical protein
VRIEKRAAAAQAGELNPEEYAVDDAGIAQTRDLRSDESARARAAWSADREIGYIER